MWSTADGSARNRRPAWSLRATHALLLALLLYGAAVTSAREAEATVLGETLGGGLLGTETPAAPGGSEPAAQGDQPAPAATQPAGGTSGSSGGVLGAAGGVVGGAGDAAGTVVGGVTEASEPVVSPVAQAVGGTVVEPAARAAEPVLQPASEVTGSVVSGVEPMLRPVTQAAAPVVSPIRDAVQPVVEPVTEPVSGVTGPVVGVVAPNPAPPAPEPPPAGPPAGPGVPGESPQNPAPENGGAVGRGDPRGASSAADPGTTGLGIEGGSGTVATPGTTADGRSKVVLAGGRGAPDLPPLPNGGPVRSASGLEGGGRFMAAGEGLRRLVEAAVPAVAGELVGLPFAAGTDGRRLVAAVYASGAGTPLSVVGDAVHSGVALEGSGSSFGIGLFLCAILCLLFPRGVPAWVHSREAARASPPRPPGGRPG